MNAAPYPSPGDRLTGGGVDRLGAHAGPDGPVRRLLRVLQHLVVGEEAGGRLADRVGPGAVRTVAGRHHPADVHDHRVPRAQHPVGDPVVRAGRVRAGADDHEIHLGVPLGQDGLGDQRSHLAFGPAGLEPAPGPARAPGRSRPRPPAAPRPRRGSCASAGPAAPSWPGPGGPPGIASRNRSTIRAHIWSASPATLTGPSRRAIRVYGYLGFLPGDHLQPEARGR